MGMTEQKEEEQRVDVLDEFLQNIKSKNSNVQLMAFVNKTKEDHAKHKLLQDKYKKMMDILGCYKQRDETNNSLRKAWSKHMNALEKALCQQDAATCRWREQAKAHEEI